MAGERLEELAWMVGKWEEADKADDLADFIHVRDGDGASASGAWRTR